MNFLCKVPNNKSAPERSLRVGICAVLAAAVLIVYWRVQYYDFIDFDDNMYIIENTHLQSGLTYRGLTWAFTTTHTTNWHPLTWLSLMFDYELYGLNPAGYHWTNTIFHLVSTILLFLFLHRVTGEAWKSAFVAALFAIHPLNVESVAWVAERKNVLSTFFWILTMWAYVLYVKVPVFGRYALVVLSFALGLMTKPVLVTLPFVLLLLDYWPLNRFPPGAAGGRGACSRWSGISPFVYEKIPLFVLSCASCVVTFCAAKSGGAVRSLATFPFDVRMANVPVSYVRYLEKMVWPQNLTIFYPHEGMIIQWKIVVSCLLIAVFTVFAFSASRRFRYLPVGWLWYLGTMLPVIGLVQVGFQSMADRYAYIPLVGIFIILSWGIADIFERFHVRKALVMLLAGGIILFLLVFSWRQVQHWQNSVTIFQHALNVTKRNYHAHLGMGNVFLHRGDLNGARWHYLEALRFKPDHAEVLNNLGMVLMYQGKFAEAMLQYQEALRIKPNEAKIHNNMGVLLARQGKMESAIAQFREALRIDPLFAEARGNLLVAEQVQRSNFQQKVY